MTKKPAKSEFDTLLSEHDKLFERQRKLQSTLEQTEVFQSYHKTTEKLSEVQGQLKTYVPKKGDFHSKFYKFSSYDQTKIDHKKIVENLLEQGIIDQDFIDDYTETKTYFRAALIPNCDKDE